MEKNEIIGYFGSKQLLEFVMKNPTSSALKNNTVKNLPQKDHFLVFSPSNTLRDIFNEWKKSEFAYSLIQDGDKLSSVSVLSILEFINLYDLPNEISEIPKKDVITYDNDDTVNIILDKMFQHHVRRLMLKDSTDVLSDRVIVDAICNDFDFLRKTPDFLSIKAKSFNLRKTNEISTNSKIVEVAHNMLKENHYVAISNGQIITQWDIVSKFFEIIDGK